MNLKNIVLIDFESVQPETLPSLDLPHWHLMLFVGANQLKVPLALAMAMQRMGDRAESRQIAVARSTSPPNPKVMALHMESDPLADAVNRANFD